MPILPPRRVQGSQGSQGSRRRTYEIRLDCGTVQSGSGELVRLGGVKFHSGKTGEFFIRQSGSDRKFRWIQPEATRPICHMHINFEATFVGGGPGADVTVYLSRISALTGNTQTPVSADYLKLPTLCWRLAIAADLSFGRCKLACLEFEALALFGLEGAGKADTKIESGG
ncbi:hypothetical protein R3P38DRAFT_2791317 [Favolaschia claudopus]|uniref:Uncharacterized protein n=1 Tax=Favolaschia claudopus TaxID=2862362 RepID=A0AAW0AHP3_9AGAR